VVRAEVWCTGAVKGVENAAPAMVPATKYHIKHRTRQQGAAF